MRILHVLSIPLPIEIAVFGAGAALAVWTVRQARRRVRTLERDRQRTADELNRRLSELFWLQELSYVLSESIKLERIVEQVVRYATVTREPAAQLLNVRFRYERSRDGQVVGNEHASFQMRWFWRYELEHLLARTGFSEVAIHGDFDRSPISHKVNLFDLHHKYAGVLHADEVIAHLQGLPAETAKAR